MTMDNYIKTLEEQNLQLREQLQRYKEQNEELVSRVEYINENPATGKRIYTAYLIVICDKDTHKILDVEIWSSPEWEQSQRLSHPTYVAFEWRTDEGFGKARNQMIEWLNDTNGAGGRYEKLMKIYNKKLEKFNEDDVCAGTTNI